MNPKYSLPVVLVSACDKATAEEFISELIDNEVTKEDGEESDVDLEDGAGRVWRLVNKYYRADVLVQARGDSDPPLEEDARVEAHVAYFTPGECEAAAESVEACAERRTSGAAGQAAVRVAALRTTREGALGAWAARARYEPVALQHEDGGIARTRDALHAHPWPGLRRHDCGEPPLPLRDSEESSSGGEEEEDEGEEADVDRAEQFALALGALGELTAGGGNLSDAEHRERAEQLLAAFCSALGHRLDF